MFRKLYLFLLVYCGMFSMLDVSSASVVYIPAPHIYLTGTTSDVRFDVSEPLFGSSYSGAYIDTTTRYMSGVFYIQSIGWAMASTGSYQVILDCGSQTMDDLVLPCQFSGSGWSENTGEL